MSQHITAENFPPYTQHSSGEFLKQVTRYYKTTKIISRYYAVQFDYSFLKKTRDFQNDAPLLAGRLQKSKEFYIFDEIYMENI